ncbi:MAG: NAD(P)H-binding protein [Actinomycetota bacterium]|nr:NAD(P)H-binding protein [Actinomycetota bacterium]
MSRGRKMLVAGATGYIGRKLCLALAEKGSPPRAMARKPGRAQDLAAAGCEIVPGDVLRRETLGEPLEGVDSAYYLVHSMGRGGQGDFAERDREGAANFAAAAAEAGVEQIVYLGGLSDTGSKHLESRHATAEELASTKVPVTYLRAAAVIGSGSESFRTLFYLTKRLPVMVTPKWVDNRTQPIAIRDLIEILGQVPKIRKARGMQIDIGGPDVTTYGGMMDSMARAMGRRPPIKLPVPVLSPSLSSLWIGLVTPVDAGVARPLVQGLSVETIVQDPSGMELFDLELTTVDEAMGRAIAEGDGSLD